MANSDPLPRWMRRALIADREAALPTLQMMAEAAERELERLSTSPTKSAATEAYVRMMAVVYDNYCAVMAADTVIQEDKLDVIELTDVELAAFACMNRFDKAIMKIDGLSQARRSACGASAHDQG